MDMRIRAFLDLNSLENKQKKKKDRIGRVSGSGNAH